MRTEEQLRATILRVEAAKLEAKRLTEDDDDAVCLAAQLLCVQYALIWAVGADSLDPVDFCGIGHPDKLHRKVMEASNQCQT